MLGKSSYTHGPVLRPVSEDALDPRERSCCICYQPFRSTSLTHTGPEVPVQLPCGHVFGEWCILSWTLNKNSCPLCRRNVFETNDHPTNQHISISQDSSAEIFTPADQLDIWLDVDVWNRPAQDQLQETVSSVDIEFLLELYTSTRSTVYSSSEPQTSDGKSTCASHCDSSRCTDKDGTRAAIVPRSSTTALCIDVFDLTELGAQFATLDCHNQQWMDEYLNEPTFDEPCLESRF